jgi:hypothetical protein
VHAGSTPHGVESGGVGSDAHMAPGVALRSTGVDEPSRQNADRLALRSDAPHDGHAPYGPNLRVRVSAAHTFTQTPRHTHTHTYAMYAAPNAVLTLASRF